MALKSISYNQHTLDISYEIINPHAKVDLIVLHGWGSNKNLMKQSFSPYMDEFRHIYIDLPGFGNSTCNLILNSADYARIIELLMVHLNASKDIILGHSFGGKVALLLNPSILVLVGSAGIYLKKPLLVKMKIALTKIANFLGVKKISSLLMAQDAQKLSEPMYQTFKNVVNEDFTKKFSVYDGTALLCWGKNDTATPLGSAKKINELIKDSSLKVYDGDHYFFMLHAQDVSKQVQDTFLKTLEH
jgi:pimeloyl-ACP methyl ester carboxylesterase